MTQMASNHSSQSWFEKLLPNMADWLFLVILIRVLMVGNTSLLDDPGVPWHIQVGHDLLAGGFPESDQYSYTRFEAPWIIQYWLFDSLLSIVYDAWSWNGLVLLGALLLAWTYRCLFRCLVLLGASPPWALVLCICAAGCGAPNWFARPHLSSLLLFVLVLHSCVKYHRFGGWHLWIVPPLMLAWCNLHGGFLAGFVILACSLIGQLLETPRDGKWRRRSGGFAIAGFVSLMITTVNPYGWRLHQHLGDILFTSQVTDLIQEWRSPNFQLAESLPIQVTLLALIALPALCAKRLRPFYLVHLVAWVHFALLAIRQGALLGMVAAFALASLGPDLWKRWMEWAPVRVSNWMAPFGTRLRALTREERKRTYPGWSTALSLCLMALTVQGLRIDPLGIGTARLNERKWPVTHLRYLNADPTPGRVFHELAWGGLLIQQGNRPVFIDDRFELYDRQFVLEYLDALQCGPTWEKLCQKYQFRFALIKPDSPLARHLSRSASWSPVHRTEGAVLFKRVATAQVVLGTRWPSFGDSAGFRSSSDIRGGPCDE